MSQLSHSIWISKCQSVTYQYHKSKPLTFLTTNHRIVSILSSVYTARFIYSILSLFSSLESMWHLHLCWLSLISHLRKIWYMNVSDLAEVQKILEPCSMWWLRNRADDMIWYDMIWYEMILMIWLISYDTIRYDTIGYDTKWYDIWYDYVGQCLCPWSIAHSLYFSWFSISHLRKRKDWTAPF